MIFCPLSHHMMREWCLSPGCFFGTEENAFCPLSHHMMREWCLLPGPDAFLGLRKMHFAHFLTIWLGSHVYPPWCRISSINSRRPSKCFLRPHRFTPNPCQAVEQQVPWFEVTWPFSKYGSFGCFFLPGEKASTPSTLDEIHIGPLRCGSALGTLRCALRVAACLLADCDPTNSNTGRSRAMLPPRFHLQYCVLLWKVHDICVPLYQTVGKPRGSQLRRDGQ